MGLVLALLCGLAFGAIAPLRHHHHRHADQGALRSDGCNSVPATQVDDLIIGGGPAGAHYLYRRSALPESASVVLIDSASRVGGALKGTVMRHPVTGLVRSPIPHRIGTGAMRIAGSLSYHAQRCLGDELGIESQGSPFHSTYVNRGGQKQCAAPTWNGPDVPLNPYDASPFQWGDNCSEDELWKGNATCPGRYLGVAGVSESAAYNWLVGYSTSDPKTGADCTPVSTACGLDHACSPDGKKLDISTFFKTVYGSNEAAFLRDFNYGFLGDFLNGVSACHWSEWTQREWDTTNIAFYPVGGMEEVILRMVSRSQQQAVQHGHQVDIRVSTTAQEIWKNTGSDATTHPYRVLVRSSTGASEWFAAKRVVLAIGSTPLSRIGGDLGNTLRNSTFVKQTKSVAPAVVNLQFPTRWWSSVGDEAGVTHRIMGEGTCLSRIEWTNIPEWRDMNVMRAAYSDGHCQQIYFELDRLPEPQRTNTAIEYVLGELRRLFPDLTIPNPIGYPWSGNTSDYIGAVFHVWHDGPWHWLRPGTTHQQEDVAAFATNPIPGEQLCLAGDAWDLAYSGWTTAAIRSSSWCVERFFPGRSAEWKPASTSCCEFRLSTNATVDGSVWYNWNARANVQGCGEENWFPGASYLTHERTWPLFESWQSQANSTTCAIPRNAQGAIDTTLCGVNADSYRHPAARTKKDVPRTKGKRNLHRAR